MNHPGKRSKWYPVSKKPDMPGWYEFSYRGSEHCIYRMFDGEHWIHMYANTKLSWELFVGSLYRWRGLAEEPK